MSAPSLSELFRRFTKDGDVRALGEVFDRVAPELLRVARHLAGDEAAAEDLVQATFLAAIEHPERFDPTRDLVPWLLGILANKARVARTSGARVPDPSRLPEERFEDPATDAQLREFMGTLERALERVPEAYRGVLRIHLAEGKTPEEIARELERSPDTVRVQLHRGLRHLRRRLPAGFALGGLVLVSAPRGMEAVRIAVLGRAAGLAGSAAAGGAAAGLAGGVLVGKKILVTALVVVLASGSWWLLREPPGPSQDGQVVEIARNEPDASAGRRSVEVAALDRPEASSILRSRDRSPAAEDPYGSIEVEWKWSDGSPAVGIGVLAIPNGEEYPWDHVVHATTDEGGRIKFERVREGPIELQTERGCSSEYFQSTVEGGQTTLEHLAVRPGIEVCGRVLAPDGRPIAAARIWVTGHADDGGAAVATSQKDGTYSVRDVDPSCLLFATAPEFGSSPAESLQKRASDEHGARLVDLRVRDIGGLVEGFVRDSEARPLAGAWVRVRFSNIMSWPTLWMTTGADGSYRFEGVRAGNVDVLVDKAGFASWTGKADVEAGRGTRVDPRLESGFVIEGSARTMDGTPAAGAEVAQGPGIVSPKYVWRRNLTARTDLTGSYRLACIPSGSTEFRIVLEDGERTLRASATLLGRSGDVLTWSPILEESPRIVGRVVDDAGRPLAGWRVEAGTREEVHYFPRSATTDGEGRFALRDCPDALFTVAAFSPQDEGHDSRAAGAYLDDVSPGGGEILLEVPKSNRPGAFLIGRIVDEHGSPIEAVRIVARSSRSIWNNSAAASAETGSFRIGPLPAGNYEPQLIRGRLPYTALPKVEILADEERDLGTIALKPSGRLEVVLLRDDGALVENYGMRLYGGGWGHLLETEDGATFRSKELYEGSYTLFPVGRNVATVVRGIEIRPGETTRLEIRLPAGLLQRVYFRLPEAENRPGPLHVAVRMAAGAPLFERDFSFATDKNGRSFAMLAAGFAPGQYHVEARTADGCEADASFEISGTTTSTENLEVMLVRKP